MPNEAQPHAVPPSSAVAIPHGDPALAHRKRIAGHSWRDAAAASGFGDEVEARLAVTSWLSRGHLAEQEQQRAERIALEVERLDALQAAWWKRATESSIDEDGLTIMDDRAANIVLKTIATRAKILGLDVPDKQIGPVSQTIIISGGSSEEFIEGMKRVIGGETTS